MDALSKTLFDIIFNIINFFLSVIFLPFNDISSTVLAGLLTAEQLTNFYDVINDYVLPAAGFFVNIVPPMTWNAILIFITFYVGLYSCVMAGHIILKILRVAKRLIPFI